MKHPDWESSLKAEIRSCVEEEQLAEEEMLYNRMRLFRLRDILRCIQEKPCRDGGRHHKHLGCSGRSYDLT